MTLFRDKYRIESTRLPAWDYATSGWYFVTISTQGRAPFFGVVVDGKVRLSRAGQIAKEQWQKTARLRPNVLLDEWIVMPNHIHGIVVIEDMEARSAAEVPHLPTETPQRGVSTRSASRRWTPGSLGAIINQFKGACTKRIRAASLGEFAWQPRFYDHIIRNERSLRDIRQYIRDNPLKWESDQYYV